MNNLLRHFVESTLHPVIVSDLAGRIVAINGSAAQIFGYPCAQLLGKPIELLVPKRSRESHSALREAYTSRPLTTLMRGERPVFGRHKAGHDIPLEIGLGPISTPEGPYIVSSIRDMSNTVSLQAKLARLARNIDLAEDVPLSATRKDPLTSLPTRRSLRPKVAALLQRCRDRNEHTAAMLIDCDDLATINRHHGHQIGDRVLAEVATRIQACLTLDEPFARVGGDEFLVVSLVRDSNEAREKAERIRLAVAGRPLLFSTDPLHCSVSIGVSIVPSGLSTPEHLIAFGRLAMETAKRLGKNQTADESANGDEHSAGRDTMAGRVRAILATGSLTALVQPIVEVPTSIVTGYELLGRGPAGPLHTPAALFGAARECGLIATLDAQLFTSSLGKVLPNSLRGWVHINLFPATLIDLPLAVIAEHIGTLGENQRIRIELSEHEFVGNTDQLVTRLAQLRSMDIELAIDDVGVGFGTLESVLFLEPSVIKIDRAFVSHVDKDSSKRRKLVRLLRLAAVLDAEVIAEGVETPEELAVISDLGIPFAQGFLWSRPVPIDAAAPYGERIEPLTAR